MGIRVSVLLAGSGSCDLVEGENHTNSFCPGNAKCLLSNGEIEGIGCNQMNDSHQTRGSEGLSGDLDMTRMEWELLAFDISWEFDFRSCGGEGRHFLFSGERRHCVLGGAQGF